jgi:hypothetical protein
MKVRIKIPTSQETEYLALLVEFTSGVLEAISDIQDINAKYLVDKQHLC